MHDPDQALIGEVMKRLLRAISFEVGDRPAYNELTISSLDEVVRVRQTAVDAGELNSFEETELGWTMAHQLAGLGR